MDKEYVRKQIDRYIHGSAYHVADALYLIANHCNFTKAVNFSEMTAAEKTRTRAFIAEFERR